MEMFGKQSWRLDAARLERMLRENGQAHLFAGWQLGVDEEMKRGFFDQVCFE